MSDTVQCWLAERDYGQKNLVTLVYATPDGKRAQTSQHSTTMLRQKPATAASEVPAEELESVDNSDDRERYRREVERVRSKYDPDEEI